MVEAPKEVTFRKNETKLFPNHVEGSAQVTMNLNLCPVRYVRADIADEDRRKLGVVAAALKEVLIDVAATKHCDLPRETAEKARAAIAEIEGEAP